MESNHILDKLPAHLRVFIKDQEYERYTSVDQAVWRYVMRVNVKHLDKVAHESYMDGLKKAGLEVDTIAHLYGMNRILKEIGWAAVAVDGFIPPSAFMEFQAWKVLVIAADIRQLKHIEYTPAPDIIHEAAGHAPIIANPEYAEYLRYFGEIGSKALSSAKDFELYEAIRHLSIIKEYPFTPAQTIEEAEQKIAFIQSNMGEPSEMALIRRLHWWTVEYGLIGTLDNPKIYGAGLLSSIGESVSCMDTKVKKLPYTMDAMNVEFDITKQQPQLFVTPDFPHLTKVLDQFANTMALRKGGLYGVVKAIESGNIATCLLSSGLQISGVFNQYAQGVNGQPAWFRTSGLTALACNNKQLEGNDKSNYRSGFIAIIGHLSATDKAPELLSGTDLDDLGIVSGAEVSLNWDTGTHVSGTVDHIVRSEDNKLLYIKVLNARLLFKDEVVYSGAVLNVTFSSAVVSVYSGSADRAEFKDFPKIPAEQTVKVHYDTSTKRLHELYSDVRKIRVAGSGYDKLMPIYNQLRRNYKDDWLLSMEICELLGNETDYINEYMEVRLWLKQFLNLKPEFANLINDGLQLIDESNMKNA
jgi:phenylalanine-4-hydroxylase